MLRVCVCGSARGSLPVRAPRSLTLTPRNPAAGKKYIAKHARLLLPHLAHGLVQVHGQAHHARLVADGARHRLPNPPVRVPARGWQGWVGGRDRVSERAGWQQQPLSSVNPHSKPRAQAPAPAAGDAVPASALHTHSQSIKQAGEQAGRQRCGLKRSTTRHHQAHVLNLKPFVGSNLSTERCSPVMPSATRSCEG